jgi:hypothetical protein
MKRNNEMKWNADLFRRFVFVRKEYKDLKIE